MTDVKENLEREAFEEWYCSKTSESIGMKRYLNGRFRNPETENMYLAWRAAKSHAAQSEWISIEDRMPEVNQSVLVLRNWNGKLSQCVDRLELHHDCEKPEGEQDWYDFLYSYICEVTHWQPLPTPPNKEINNGST